MSEAHAVPDAANGNRNSVVLGPEPAGREQPPEERNEAAGYPGAARVFHWLMAALILIAWFIGFYAANLRGDLPRGGMSLTIHKALGSTVIFLVLARLGYRILSHRRFPVEAPGMSRAMAMVAKAVHWSLYALVMIAAPLSGWYWSSVGGHPVSLLGIVDLPPIASRDPGAYDFAMWLHRATVWGGGGLILIHILAVLKHVLVDRDEVLGRMLKPATRVGRPLHR